MSLGYPCASLQAEPISASRVAGLGWAEEAAAATARQGGGDRAAAGRMSPQAMAEVHVVQESSKESGSSCAIQQRPWQKRPDKRQHDARWEGRMHEKGMMLERMLVRCCGPTSCHVDRNGICSRACESQVVINCVPVAPSSGGGGGYRPNTSCRPVALAPFPSASVSAAGVLALGLSAGACGAW